MATATPTQAKIPGYIRLEQAAELIGVHPATVWRYAHGGLLDFVQVGNVHLVSEKQAKRFKRPNVGRPPKDPAKRG